MTRKYLSLAELIPPSVLDSYMTDSNNRGIKHWKKMTEKYGKYFPILEKHCMNEFQFSGASGILFVIMECLEKVLNDQTKAS